MEITNTKIKRNPGAGRKRKLTEAEQIEVLKSTNSVKYLAKNFNVSIDTIYIIYRRNKIKNMDIEIEAQPDGTPPDELESCIFCNQQTVYWNIASNRPVCPVCSICNNPSDIKSAPYNY